MEVLDAAPDRPLPPLFHVASRAIPAGEILRPYAIAHESTAFIQVAGQALDDGADTVRSLLAGEAWGRLFQQGDYRAEMVLLEAIFEQARRRTAPEQPSRLEVVFLWRTLALARRFRAEYRRDGIIHRCTLVAGTSAERDGALVVQAFEAADLTTPSADDLRRVEERAVRYWRAAEPMVLPELLVRGSVAVEAVVDSGDEDRPG